MARWVRGHRRRKWRCLRRRWRRRRLEAGWECGRGRRARREGVAIATVELAYGAVALGVAMRVAEHRRVAAGAARRRGRRRRGLGTHAKVKRARGVVADLLALVVVLQLVGAPRRADRWRRRRRRWRWRQHPSETVLVVVVSAVARVARHVADCVGEHRGRAARRALVRRKRRRRRRRAWRHRRRKGRQRWR